MPDIKKIDTNFSNQETTKELKYYDPVVDNNISVYGLPWFVENQNYYRFPKTNEEEIKALSEGLWTLATQTAGAMLAFRTNTKTLKIKVDLGAIFNMGHMAFTGQGGCDLYIGNGLSDLIFYRCASFGINQKHYEFTYFENQSFGEKLYLINLPLYAGVEKIEIGVDEDAKVESVPNLFTKGRIVTYGTSITQGGCASRPGMCYTNQLSRMLGYEVINLGFSGNGRAQEEVRKLVASIKDVKLFILDYEANVTFVMLKDTLIPFIKYIRAQYPTVPIIVASKVRMSAETLLDSAKKAEAKLKNYQRKVVRDFSKEDQNIYFVDGTKLLVPFTTEATVDGGHPTDLGFALMAKNLAKEIKKCIS